MVLLIDEYDKPIIDFLGTDELDKARQNQQVLKSFYSVVKNSDAYLRFFMITGVSKFTKVGVSDLNNLYDISLSPKFATLAGLTEAEVVQHFSDRIRKLASDTSDQDFLQRIRNRYNGYAFAPNAVRVYNPFGLLVFIVIRGCQGKPLPRRHPRHLHLPQAVRTVGGQQPAWSPGCRRSGAPHRLPLRV